jgi:hypothetical protein
MNDIALNWQDLLIILAAFASVGTLSSLLISKLQVRSKGCLSQAAPPASPCQDMAITEHELTGNFSTRFDTQTKRVVIEATVKKGDQEYPMSKEVDPFAGPFHQPEGKITEAVLQILQSLLNKTMPSGQQGTDVGLE